MNPNQCVDNIIII